MKKMFVLSMLVASATICSCQKQDALTEAQLAQRKTELDAREETLIQREKAVDEREKAVAEREKAVADKRIIQSQRQAPDAAQAEAERLDAAQAEAKRPDAAQAEAERLDAAQAEAEKQKTIQQLPPEFQALIRDHSSLDSRSEIEKLKRGFEEMRAKNMGAIASPKATSDTQPTSSLFPSPTPE
jgi:hypothetical protein